MTKSPSTPGEADWVPRNARLTTILLVGRVFTGTGDDLCRVRNISAGGMRIETLAPVDVGQQIAVELKNGVTVRSEVVWVGKAEAGVRFDEPVDIEQVLVPAESPKRGKSSQTMRSPRLSARCPVALRCEGRIVPALLTDVSQGGVQLHWSGATIGTQVVLFIPGLASRRATVRWVRDEVVGLSFADKLGFADLARWLAGPDRFAPASNAQASEALNQRR